jgi:very-short-patch-repair endonuclease
MPIKNIVTDQIVTKAKLERAKELRREMTPAEKLLWQEVRANKLGVRFRRQQVIQGFIVDFYCHQAGLVVEVDGMSTICRKRKMNGGRRCCPRWG